MFSEIYQQLPVWNCEPIIVYVPRLTVSRIALVSPQRSQQIEGILLGMAQTGQLRGRVSEEQLIDLLEQVCLCFTEVGHTTELRIPGRRGSVEECSQERIDSRM